MNRPELSPPSADVAIIQVLNAQSGVSNVNVNLKTGMDAYFPINQGVALPDFHCSTGEANIDNVCICSKSSTSTPFTPHPEEYRQAYMDKLFSPMMDSTPETPAARMVAERFSQKIRQ